MLITHGDQVQAPGKRRCRPWPSSPPACLTGVVSGVHLLPFYPYSSDDGFSVIDFRAVDPRLGDWRMSPAWPRAST